MVRKPRRLLTLLATLLLALTMPVSAISATTVNAFEFDFVSAIYDTVADTTTFSYLVSGTRVDKDLSHWILTLGACASVVAASPGGWEVLTDPTTGLFGIKWDRPLLTTETGTLYTVTLQGNVAAGDVMMAYKAGTAIYSGLVTGPVCTGGGGADDDHYPPVADPGGPYDGFEGSPVPFDGMGSTDPDGDELSYEWNFGDGTGGAGPAPDHTYAENGVYWVCLTVADPYGLSDTDCTVATIANVAPGVSARGDSINEGDSATVQANFTDPGVLDTHTATIDWGDGSAPESVAVDQGAGSGSLTASHVYGDNGDYTVTITVTDDDGGVGSATATVAVANVAPDVVLDTTGAISLTSGPAFTGKVGVAQSHQATATDPGSDDLTFAWNFGGTTTYYNNGSSPDPALSPGGTFPFSASDAETVTFDAPGLYTVSVTATDDDGGMDTDSLAKVVLGNASRMRTQGFWGHQFGSSGSHQVDDATLQAYLNIINFASAVYSEQVPASTLAEAAAVFQTTGTGMRNLAQAQLLAAWLNFAHGSVDWTEAIDTDGDGLGDMALATLLSAAEAILLDADATHEQLEQAKDLAEAVNLRDQDLPEVE